MTTAEINTTGSKSTAKAMGADVAKAAAAVAAGAVVGAVGNDIINGEPEVTEEMVAAGDATKPTEEVKPEEQTTEQTTEHVTGQTAQQTQATAEQTHAEGPQPVSSSSSNSSSTSSNTTAQSTSQPQTSSNVVEQEEVDPDLIAQEIISGEEIDPDDIDAADIVNFTEVGTVYGADGHEYASAVITDGEGNEMVIVDIDNDNEFDVILDDDGSIACEMPGNLNVSDAELDINADPGYMAQTDADLAVGTDNLTPDIITT